MSSFYFFIIFTPFRFKINGRGRRRRESQGVELNFASKIYIYHQKLDLGFKNLYEQSIEFHYKFSNALSSDVNLEMTYFRCGKQFCNAFMSTFCYFVKTCDTLFIYQKLDLGFKNLFQQSIEFCDKFSNALLSDVKSRMTYFLCGKQFCVAFMSTFCYFIITCDTI